MVQDSKNHKSDFAVMALILFIICALVASVLSLANHFTAPIIERSAEERLTQSLQNLILSANRFEPVDEFEKNISFGETKVPVAQIYQAFSEGSESLGYCVQVLPKGYVDTIDMLVAIDKDGAVSGVKILSISETPGIGFKVSTDEAFQEKFLGLDDSVKAVKKTSSIGEIQVISGATISSSAYINGVNAAIEAVRNLKAEAAK